MCREPRRAVRASPGFFITVVSPAAAREPVRSVLEDAICYARPRPRDRHLGDLGSPHPLSGGMAGVRSRWTDRGCWAVAGLTAGSFRTHRSAGGPAAVWTCEAAAWLFPVFTSHALSRGAGSYQPAEIPAWGQVWLWLGLHGVHWYEPPTQPRPRAWEQPACLERCLRSWLFSKWPLSLKESPPSGGQGCATQPRTQGQASMAAAHVTLCWAAVVSCWRRGCLTTVSEI